MISGAPKWLRTELAGHDFYYGQRPSEWNVVYHDEESGRLIFKTNDCDGGHRTIKLTRDHKEVKEFAGEWCKWIKQPVRSEAFNGFSLYDSDTDLKRILGGPTSVSKEGRYRRWHYVWNDVKNGEGVKWQNEYVFRDGKCVEIIFRRDSVPGCGELFAMAERWTPSNPMEW